MIAVLNRVIDLIAEEVDLVVRVGAVREPHLVARRVVTTRLLTCAAPEYLRAHAPKLWIHGHTHERCDYQLGTTRVVANPLGYPNELRSLEAFDSRFQVEV